MSDIPELTAKHPADGNANDHSLACCYPGHPSKGRRRAGLKRVVCHRDGTGRHGLGSGRWILAGA